MRRRATLQTIRRLRLYQAERAPDAAAAAAAVASALVAAHGAEVAGQTLDPVVAALAAAIGLTSYVQWRFASDRADGVSPRARGLVRPAEVGIAMILLGVIQACLLAALDPALMATTAAFWILLLTRPSANWPTLAGATLLAALGAFCIGLVARGGDAGLAVLLSVATLGGLATVVALVHPPRRSPLLIGVLALAIALVCAAALALNAPGGLVIPVAIAGFLAAATAAATADGRGRPVWTQAAALVFVAIALITLGLGAQLAR